MHALALPVLKLAQTTGIQILVERLGQLGHKYGQTNGHKGCHHGREPVHLLT
jgi:hypothetical protein